jgi:hypothetical protein
MAEIVTNDLAPKDDTLTFSLANVEFQTPYETDDRDVLANASVHPWLDVKYPEVPADEGVVFQNQPTPAEDPLSRVNDDSNDPAAVAAAREQAVDPTPLAIDAGLDQDKIVKDDADINVTLAADEADPSTDDSPAPKSRAKKGS